MHYSSVVAIEPIKKSILAFSIIPSYEGFT